MNACAVLNSLFQRTERFFFCDDSRRLDSDTSYGIHDKVKKYKYEWFMNIYQAFSL